MLTDELSFLSVSSAISCNIRRIVSFAYRSSKLLVMVDNNKGNIAPTSSTSKLTQKNKKKNEHQMTVEERLKQGPAVPTLKPTTTDSDEDDNGNKYY